VLNGDQGLEATLHDDELPMREPAPMRAAATPFAEPHPLMSEEPARGWEPESERESEPESEQETVAMAPRREAGAAPFRPARATMSREAGREARTDRAERHRERPESAPDMNADELSSTSQRLTEELLKAMGFEPRVSVRAEGNRVDVTVEVDRDDELLNGREGETRQALQHLLNRFLNKGDGSRYHLQLEVNDHWQQRENELVELSRRLAEDAATRRVEVVSDFLNSQERRIMHMTLREDSRVRTYSLGSGAVKRVAVAPADFPERSEEDPS
jgi:spoIIIJ-associated protein